MLKRLHFENRESWLAGRNLQGIGGSEAAAAIGLSPWQTPLELWKLKTGWSAPKDLSGNDAVERGVTWEPILRNLYAETHPEHHITHFPYDILCQSERPYIFATLDGEIETEDGRRGVLEIKTASPRGREGFKDWADGHLPMHYFVQTLHELLASGYDFVILYAALFSMDGTVTIKPPYEIERCEHEADLKWLLEQEREFWGCVQRGEMPPQRLML